MLTPTKEGLRDSRPAAMRRISWGAVFAGVIIVLVVQLCLSLFGIGIGASTIDPINGETPAASSLSIAATIWWLVASVIALAAGGWVAGRLAGMPHQTDGLLHGFITWGAATLITVYFLTTAAGSILGGTFGVLGQALAVTGQGIAGLGPAVGDIVTDQLKQSDVTWEDIKAEARILLEQTGKESLQPEMLSEKTADTTRQIRDSAEASVTQPRQTDEAFLTLLDQIIRKGEDVVSEVDREAVVNVLIARTNLNQEEAEKVVQRWTTTYRQTVGDVTATYDDLKGQAEQQARAAADATAEAISQASIWTFVSMVFGASAAGIGGAFGAPRDLVDPVNPAP